MLHFVDTTPSRPAVTHVIPKGKPVVFVVRFVCPQIEIYDAVTFTLLRCLAVPGLGLHPFGLAVCPSNISLYASDSDNDGVHSVELSDSNAVMKWSVARQPAGLTVNRAQNLLVVA